MVGSAYDQNQVTVFLQPHLTRLFFYFKLLDRHVHSRLAGPWAVARLTQPWIHHCYTLDTKYFSSETTELPCLGSEISLINNHIIHQLFFS